MKKAFRIFRLLIVGAILLYILVNHGRATYMPVIKGFKEKQTIGSVVEIIEKDVLARLQPSFAKAGIDNSPTHLTLVAFKEERILQVFTEMNGKLEFIKQYPFTASSGQLGPKLKEGDKQIPEGIYGVEYLNPNSSYHLSIKVSYPNAFDKSKTTFEDEADMGDDIFIHGKSVSVGCIPIGDQAIEELFYMVSKAKKQNIKILISPRDFRKKSEYPSIPNIDWEKELYDLINAELETIPTVE